MQNFDSDSISIQAMNEIVNEEIFKTFSKSISELLLRTNLQTGLTRLKIQANFEPIIPDTVNKIIEDYFAIIINRITIFPKLRRCPV